MKTQIKLGKTNEDKKDEENWVKHKFFWHFLAPAIFFLFINLF